MFQRMTATILQRLRLPLRLSEKSVVSSKPNDAKLASTNNPPSASVDEGAKSTPEREKYYSPSPYRLINNGFPLVDRDTMKRHEEAYDRAYREGWRPNRGGKV